MPGQSGLTDVIFNTLYGQQHNLFRTVQQLLQQVVTTTTNEQEKIDAARLAFDLIQRVNDDEGGDLDEFRQGLQHELALRVMKLIGQDPSGQEALDHALELYALDSGVRLIVLELLMRALLQCVQDLVQNPDSIDVQESNLGTVIESVTHHCEAYMKLRAHGYPFALEYQHVEVGPALSFLAAAVTQMHPLPETLYWAYSGILMVSLRSKSNRLSGPACTALHALWSATPVVTLTESIEYQSSWNDRIHVPDWIATLLWRTLYVLTHTSRLTDRNTAGFALWLQALTNADQCLDRRILKRDRYWQVLRKGLSTGSNEQKKYALRILLVSVPMTSDDRDHETKIYTRYATLFETIVLSRYLNQVQDSLPDLSKASVAPIWIVTLLQAALSHGMQDSIRKVVGAWTLTKGLNVVAASGVAGTFVRDALLPWAALGYHCTSSVRQTPQGLVCDHGEGLSCFLAQLIAQSRDAPGLVRSSLEFLVLQDRHMFPFGRAYILDGLIRGIKCTALPLDEECLSLIVKIHMVQGFQSLVQDLMNAQCYELVMCASGNARDARYVAASYFHLLHPQSWTVRSYNLLTPLSKKTGTRRDASPIQLLPSILANVTLAIYIR